MILADSATEYTTDSAVSWDASLETRLHPREQYACNICKHILHNLMNSKHRKTLAVVFTDPVSGTVEWSAVERLLVAAGARVIEGRGSRVRFEKDGEVETFHRPHPAKEAKRYQVRAARAFLERIGVTP